MIRRPPRSTPKPSSAASDVYKRQVLCRVAGIADGVGEVRITMDYVDDELIWTAMLLSIPAFLIAGLVLAQTVASEEEVGEQASDEES